MVHGAPVPTLPAVRIRGHAREADQVAEPGQCAEVIADVSPLMMRGEGDEDRSKPIGALLPLDLVGDDGQSLVPADALIFGNTPVPWIACAVRIEVHALHRIKNPALGVSG